jgi:hypothetical protein
MYSFPPGKDKNIGPDPIIGQIGKDADRLTYGLNPEDTTARLLIQEFVIALGGEYFFSPSIPGLKTLAAS